jgi:hypothetical protein
MLTIICQLHSPFHQPRRKWGDKAKPATSSASLKEHTCLSHSIEIRVVRFRKRVPRDDIRGIHHELFGVGGKVATREIKSHLKGFPGGWFWIIISPSCFPTYCFLLLGISDFTRVRDGNKFQRLIHGHGRKLLDLSRLVSR